MELAYILGYGFSLLIILGLMVSALWFIVWIITKIIKMVKK
jgi:hypothetical protein